MKLNLYQKTKRACHLSVLQGQQSAQLMCLQVMVSLIRGQMSRCMRKPDFCLCENKDADQLYGTADQRLYFLYKQSCLFYLNLNQVSDYFVWLFSLVSVGPVRKSRVFFFSHVNAHVIKLPMIGNNISVYHGSNSKQVLKAYIGCDYRLDNP